MRLFLRNGAQVVMIVSGVSGFISGQQVTCTEALEGSLHYGAFVVSSITSGPHVSTMQQDIRVQHPVLLQKTRAFYECFQVNVANKTQLCVVLCLDFSTGSSATLLAYAAVLCWHHTGDLPFSSVSWYRRYMKYCLYLFIFLNA